VNFIKRAGFFESASRQATNEQAQEINRQRYGTNYDKQGGQQK
jgi:hypothetical protein